jgi:hypothetical protein
VFKTHILNGIIVRIACTVDSIRLWDSSSLASYYIRERRLLRIFKKEPTKYIFELITVETPSDVVRESTGRTLRDVHVNIETEHSLGPRDTNILMASFPMPPLINSPFAQSHERGYCEN